MTESIEEKMVVADYAFRFDALPERVTFSNQIKITGWLLHRQGLPIHGIRGVVRGILRRRSIFRARRKRSRPLIAAAYPDLPEAGQSGFLLVLELPLGRSEITIQVQDHRKIWRTIFVTRYLGVSSYLSGSNRSAARRRVLVRLISRNFLSETGETLRTRSSRTRSARSRAVCLARGSKASVESSGSTQCEIRAVDSVRYFEVEFIYPRNRRLTLCRLPRCGMRSAAFDRPNSGRKNGARQNPNRSYTSRVL